MVTSHTLGRAIRVERVCCSAIEYVNIFKKGAMLLSLRGEKPAKIVPKKTGSCKIVSLITN